MADLSRWPEADDILDAALALPAADRASFLRRLAGHDPGLLAALEAVLAEATRDDGFLKPGGALSGGLGEELERRLDAEDESVSPLSTGARVEHYEIVGFLGRGGMGEVYRARDTRLHRDVALKILPDRFARSAERVARFRREARVLASLSHPGIGAIYGVAEERGVEALVLELVDGPTLAERLNGRALPLDDALAIGRRLAEAIEAAHERGILHRDLKPPNIKVTREGTVKVLDFGLAKMLVSDDDISGVLGDLSAQAPNVLLGTAPYMSPEQVRGQPLDQRADIWAFGCVLFEMLTGSRAFPGDSLTEVLERVLNREPAFGLLPPATPPAIRRLLRRTLEKDPRRRLGYIGDALLEFDEAAAPSLEPAAARRVPWLPALLVALAGLVVGIGTTSLVLQPRAASSSVARFVVPLPAGDEPVTGFQPMTALSPDGRTLVYRARRSGVVQLFRRDMHDLEPVPIPGTENATGPFFSPDGRWLAFDSDGVLKRLSLAGGPAVVICPAPGGVTAAWTPDDSIVFATNTSRVLQRVPASGGLPAPLTALDAERGDTLHLLPQVLPDGRTLLFTIAAGARRYLALRLESGETRVIADGTHGRYLAGHLVFSRAGSLWGVRFDPGRLTPVGSAAPLVEGVEHTDNTVLHFDAAPDGSIVYLPAAEREPSLQRLVWLDRRGVETPVELEPRAYSRLALSPDGTRLATAVRDRENTDIWTADLTRRIMGRLTFEPTIETMPTWSPDGRMIAFRSEREGPGIFWRDAQGAGPIERLTETDGPIHSPYSWTPDGRTLLFAIFRSFRHQAIASVTPPDRAIRVLLDGDFAQLDPQVSPDGRWMAYQSDESGRFEIYVRPYPEVGAGRWQVSTAGGTTPRWSRDGGELFYMQETRLMALRVSRGPAFAAERPRPLFEVSAFGGRLGPDFEVAPDGRRFLFIVAGPAAVHPAHLIVVQNWVEELRAGLQDRP